MIEPGLTSCGEDDPTSSLSKGIITSRTKTTTIGEKSIKAFVKALDESIKEFQKDSDWRFSKTETVQNLELLKSLLKDSPWNEGGYLVEDFYA